MKQQPYPIAKEGLSYALVLLIVTGLTALWSPLVAVFPGLLTVFVLFFFRNPRRVIPSGEILVSPADGLVMDVKEVQEDRFLKGKGTKITIFLSVFNVHLNRCPIEGTVTYRDYRAGKMLPAYKSNAADENETNYVGIENEKLKVLVTQITGLVARRIVCWVDEGEPVQKGDLFGLIKFGSCTELVVPPDVEVTVKKGDKVVGGETIVGRLRNDS